MVISPIGVPYLETKVHKDSIMIKAYSNQLFKKGLMVKMLNVFQSFDLGFPVLHSTLSYIQSNEIAYYGLFCKLFRAY